MPYIVSYRKGSDAYTEFQLQTPPGEEAALQELATVDGLTYVCVDDATVLPPQHDSIAQSVQRIDALPAPLREAIKAASPQCRYIGQRVDEMVREKYTQEQENYFSRITVGQIAGMYVMEPGEMEEVQAFGVHVEQCRQWGRDQRALLGL